MDKINWINGQAGGTPLSAENLNQMQENIEDAINIVDGRAVGEVIYNNLIGENDNIVLTKKLSNYSRIKVFSKIVFTGYTAYFITECEAIVGGSISLEQSRLHSAGLWMNDTAIYTMNEQMLTKVYEADVRISEGDSAAFNKNTNRTLIYKVIGYK